MSAAGCSSDTNLLVSTSSVSATLPTPIVLNRIVIASILVSLLWKIRYFLLAFAVYFEYPLHDEFFPAWLSSSGVSLAAYTLSVAACLVSLFSVDRRYLMGCSLLLTACLYIQCIHQHSYNDVTFLTCFWSAAWSFWFTSRIGRDHDNLLIEKGVFISHLILSVIFLGGAMGKLTPGYWSGQVLYDIYFAARDFWVFNILREHFSNDTLHAISRWYSRFVIVTEMGCACLWLLPRRWASWLAIITCCGICLFSNVLLLSVLACLLGLAVIGLHEEPLPRQSRVTGDALDVGG